MQLKKILMFSVLLISLGANALMAQGWETVMSDDFELPFPESDAKYNVESKGAAAYTWGRTKHSSVSPQNAIWCADRNNSPGPDLNPDQGYPQNVDAWLQWGPFDLAYCDSGFVNFQMSNVFNGGSDFLGVYIKTTEAAADWEGFKYTSNTAGFTEMNLPLHNWPGYPDIMGKKNIYLLFRFQSDGTGYVAQGSLIDDLSITRRILGKPDLTITEVSFDETEIQVGEMMQIRGEVQNLGNFKGLTNAVSFYMSTDQTIDPEEDVYLGRSILPDINGGGSADFINSFYVPLFMEAGSYYLGAIVDVNNDMEELDETNNTLVASGMITAQAPVGWTLIFEDSFEGSFPGDFWNRWEPVGGYTWGRSDYMAADGEWSIWCADKAVAPAPSVNPDAGYPDNVENWVEYGPIDLSDAIAATMSFRTYYKLNQGDDLMVQAFFDSDIGWQGLRLTENSGGWEYYQLDFFDWPNMPRSMQGSDVIYVRFQFKSNVGGTHLGAFVDDVLIRKKLEGEEPPPPVQTAYENTPQTIPGRIEVERFDDGGEGVAYHETTPEKEGGNMTYRADTGVEMTESTTGTYQIGWTAAGEWLEYTVNVTAPGTYDLTVYHTSPAAGGQLMVSLDGTELTTVDIPATGDWNTWALTNAVPVTIATASEHILRLDIVTAGFNFDYVDILEQTGVEDNDTRIHTFKLSQNYPNPFNPSTVIGFELPKAADVTLTVFNVHGQQIKTLVSGQMTAGAHQAVWDGTNDMGVKVASGIYFYKMTAGDFQARNKMILMY